MKIAKKYKANGIPTFYIMNKDKSVAHKMGRSDIEMLGRKVKDIKKEAVFELFEEWKGKVDELNWGNEDKEDE